MTCKTNNLGSAQILPDCCKKDLTFRQCSIFGTFNNSEMLWSIFKKLSF